ncbi:hypothetical protein F5B22DRAFT_267740 [Xylaria bambusicola]|uniref:uncharacterized protein n=1 Tax=Xylaria bambusicola TaxID=326684 RepID=UPI002007FF50|nr:uncharacterized protein F5B22DRAFT_267740 [Xylaria bambusicola]KAI0526074.1 hypothetical protein F5B22DRAFT_267740 [Xylaria bambusicola]
MDAELDSQATQQATQNAFDPRRIGQQNSGFSDQDISDIICLLYPISEAASREVQIIASTPEYACHTTERYTADAIESNLHHEDDAHGFGGTRGMGDHALVLRLSSNLKDPRLGFTFGRNRARCDICFAHDHARRLSNIHCRIYVNYHGSVLLEDQSTNGTVVDGKLLRKRPEPHSVEPLSIRRTLESGSVIKIVMTENRYDLNFLVRIPRRDGDYEDAYMRNVVSYMIRLNGGVEDDEDDMNKTIGPGPGGHVNLFAHTKKIAHADHRVGFSRTSNRPREWRGDNKYARVGVIGKGAFAVVHQVTSREDGSPYAAKELDKRKFMKNGVLDQKVENEMKIMQRVKHPNIVQYIEHFDWEPHQFFIIMEYVPGGDLGKLVQDSGAITEIYVGIIARQLVDALGYLHDNRITHRDVKPDNILIQSTNPLVVKLTDFGLSKMIDTEQTFLKTFCGTLLYCAPEVYTEYSSYDDYGNRTNRKNLRPTSGERYDHAVDIWSLGGVLFYTLTGSPPFPVKNGTTYTELLDHIIKTPLNKAPLNKAKVSHSGVHFLSRMIHVRPETRATIAELKGHPWLTDANTLPSKEFDEDLGRSASQLSLDDKTPPTIMSPSESSFGEPEPDFSMDFEQEKENHLIGQAHVPRLFGEISAIGSSGVIPEDRLNLSVSNMDFGESQVRDNFEESSCGETEVPGDEVRDSFEESDNFETPRENFFQNQNNSSVGDGPSQPDNSRSALLGFSSQSLGGASSIIKNLNVKSVAAADSDLTSSRISNLAASKRKPNYDTSDEYDDPNALRYSLKRLKSEANIDHLKDEDILFACIPPISDGDKGRQIDFPCPKEAYWGKDENTWHLNYPEMTNLQYHAFQAAATNRKEEFAQNKSPLWELAMKYFPPTYSYKPESAGSRTLQPESAGESVGWSMPQPAPTDTLDHQFDSQLAIPAYDENIPNTPPTLLTAHQPRPEVGSFKSSPGSLVSNVSIPLRDPILSWGRGMTNTVVYNRITESRVPKSAFKVALWREGYKASESDLRPWEPTRSTSSTTMRASPEPESFAFYIATKATNGIRINDIPLHSHEPKNAQAPCKYWMKLYDGDRISFWGGGEIGAQAGLIFECSWGGSSRRRPANEPPTRVSSAVADKLDRLWPRVEKVLASSRAKEDAQIDHEIRMGNLLREQERSRNFELRRMEAKRRLEHASWGTSPNDRLERARTDPLVHRFAPPGPSQEAS